MRSAIGIDLGTSYFKVALFDENAKPLALARRPTPGHHPRAGWHEMEPEAFRQTLVELLAELRKQDAAAFARTQAISFASQANTFLLLDEQDEPLTPFIVWNDRRTIEFRNDLPQLPMGPAYYPATGVSGSSGFAVPAKWLWLRTHAPAAVSRARRLRTISDQLTHWFTGQDAAEAGAAALSGLVDIHQLSWRKEAIRALGMDGLLLPRLVRAGTDLGPLAASTARSLGLPCECHFVMGCLDQYAGAIGAGNLTPGDLAETTGTVLAVVRLADRFDPAPRASLLQGPAFREGWYFQMSVGNTSANLLEAFRQVHAPDVDFATLVDDEAARVPADCDGLALDRAASEAQGYPVFRGEQPHHGRGHRVRAILEGVADALSAQVDKLRGESQPPRVIATGGAARSRLWLQIKSDRLGIPVVATDCEEPTCRGAAMLALGIPPHCT